MIAVKLWSLNQMRFAPLFGQINVGGEKIVMYCLYNATSKFP